MIPTTTKIAVLINQYSGILKELFAQIDKELPSSSTLAFTKLLKNDLGFLLYHFYFDYKNFEYETLFVTCINDMINEIKFDNGINYTRFIGQWKSLSDDKKSQFLSITRSSIIPQNNFNSVGFLTNHANKKTVNLVKELLMKISEDLINSDNHVDELEEKRFKELIKIINESHTTIDINDIAEYVQEKFKEASLRNSEDLVERPSKIKQLIISNQNKIVEADKRYVLDFLKIHNFLNIKHQQIIKTVETLNKDVKVFKTIDSLSTLIIEQVNSYNIVYYYSLNMLVGLLEGNYVVFYELYEEFDELGIFKNKFEKDLTTTLTDIKEELKTMKVDIVKKLTIIESQLEKVVAGINQINQNLNEVVNGLINIEESISNGFNSLNHTLDSNFNDLNTNLSNGLENLNSTVAFGNMINAISAYQLYKVNKNTKSLR
ncbi:hypothetical protein [Siansivirga zeaxanthinifaciens]|uniref:Uncharacterized protein n=1 Tax=Siansivirga zeaxanthinifaciens CC-SAMT-1 TaxID=1454006 RepID=A0A0C5WCA7_9FLAO|nr:hypothetical protein [Siansivirga zeaxanthinifaciens]AJR04688.1 hypothetical protein AW14_00035 [Siansivirga zeaxanthinifaciens CC-SAMT-1]